MTAVPRPVEAYLGLGANLGDAQATVFWAMGEIAQLPATRLVRQSSLYRSAPVDAEGPDFLNAVVEISTGLAASELLGRLQAIEQTAGRLRPYRNAPRTLDLDILLYGDQRIDTAALTVPHPRMGQRAFVLLPLQEIAPSRVSAADLLALGHQRVQRLQGAGKPAPAVR